MSSLGSTLLRVLGVDHLYDIRVVKVLESLLVLIVFGHLTLLEGIDFECKLFLLVRVKGSVDCVSRIANLLDDLELRAEGGS